MNSPKDTIRNLSHEVRNVVSVVKAMTKIAKSENDFLEMYNEFQKRMKYACDNLLCIIPDVKNAEMSLSCTHFLELVKKISGIKKNEDFMKCGNELQSYFQSGMSNLLSSIQETFSQHE